MSTRVQSATEWPLGRISVCIAAYNEASTIGHLLDQLVNAGDCVDEILVCANGCTDGTEAAIDRYRGRDSRIRLLRTPKGKPTAWNALMRSAGNDVRLFLDADVELAPGFLSTVMDTLRDHPQAAIVAARDLPKRRREGPGPFLAALASRSFGFDYVCGRAYALRLSAMPRIESAVPTAGHADLPPDVLHEDFWLEVTAGRSLIAFAPAACVHYDPGTVDDLLRTRARLNLARRQVADMLPQEFARWQIESNRSSSLLVRLRHRLGMMTGAADAVACVLGIATRSILLLLYRRAAMRIESRMRDQMARDGGHEVLAGSGRLSKD